MLHQNRKTNEHGPVPTRKHEQHSPPTDRRQSDYDNGPAPTYGSESRDFSRHHFEDLPRSSSDHDSLLEFIAFWLHLLVDDVVSEVKQTKSLIELFRCFPCAVLLLLVALISSMSASQRRSASIGLILSLSMLTHWT